jgi:hypothetical protein
MEKGLEIKMNLSTVGSYLLSNLALIIEGIMSNQDTLSRQEQEILEQLELLKQERELRAKLSAIRTERDKSETGKNGKHQAQPSLFNFGIPKGESSWAPYVKVAINALGKAKSNEIKEYIGKANPKMPKETIERTVTNTLWALKKENEISISDSGSRKEGYEYFLSDEQKKAAGL